ncbi:MAG: flavodoxin family protein [Clostridium sp.]|nr:flavodoxin family protein [Clostridium sp.]
MKILIHDLEEKDFNIIKSYLTDDLVIIEDDKTIKPCTGCFGCWIKTPAECLQKDNYCNLGELLSKCDGVIIISQCCYGGFSPFVKNVLDRSISYVHPYLVIVNEEMHHRRRYENQVSLDVWFYGDTMTTREKQTAQKLVYANSINLSWHVHKIQFLNYISEIEGLVI